MAETFSGRLREELEGRMPRGRHCRAAELAAILLFAGELIREEDGRICLCIRGDEGPAARKCFTLLQKTSNINARLRRKPLNFDTEFKSGRNTDRSSGKNPAGSAVGIVLEKEEAEKLFALLRVPVPPGPEIFPGDGLPAAILEKTCCRRSFLRGAFLCTGSVSDPARGYHLEFSCSDRRLAGQIRSVLRELGKDAGLMQRRKQSVVYIKDSEDIVDVLGLMDAPVSLMEMENQRIMKGVLNTVNRRMNCDYANIGRTIGAAGRQIRDIRFLEETGVLEKMPEGIRQIAALRLACPEVPLAELGCLADPPISKSGVNHRLKKISETAEAMRNGQ